MNYTRQQTTRYRAIRQCQWGKMVVLNTWHCAALRATIGVDGNNTRNRILKLRTKEKNNQWKQRAKLGCDEHTGHTQVPVCCASPTPLGYGTLVPPTQPTHSHNPPQIDAADTQRQTNADLATADSNGTHFDRQSATLGRWRRSSW